MTDHSALIERLEANEPLPICPYDRRSPEYWTTNDTDPCKFCGTKNEEGAPDLCRGADTHLFAEAAAALRDQQSKMQMMQARLDRWEPKPFCGPSFSSSFLTGQAEQPSDASRIFRPSAGSAGPLPSAPNQAKEAGE